MVLGSFFQRRARPRCADAGKRRRVARRVRLQPVDVLECRNVLQCGDQVALARVSAVAVLHDQRGRAGPLQQFDDLANRVVAMQRRAADRAVARAGEQRHHSLDPARQPHRDALARLDTAPRQIRRQRIGGVDKLAIGDAADAVPDGKGIRRALGVAFGQRIDRVAAPVARGGVAFDQFWGKARRNRRHVRIFRPHAFSRAFVNLSEFRRRRGSQSRLLAPFDPAKPLPCTM